MRRASWHWLLGLPSSDRWLLVVSFFVLPVSALALRLRGLAEVQQRVLQRWPEAAPGQARMQEARHVAHLIDVAARRGLWRANCLQRSVTLWAALRRLGIASDLRIGVRRAPDAPGMQFHAWVEIDEEVLNDASDVRTSYAAFDQPIVPRAAAFS